MFAWPTTTPIAVPSRETPAPLIELRDVTLGYGRRTVLTGVSLTLFRSDYLGIVGPNGSGKTTLLRCLLGTLPARRGEVVRRGNGSAPRIGYVPQSDSLDLVLPLTVMDVVLMGRAASKGPFKRITPEDRRRTVEALRHAGIEHLADVPYHNLSGGQRQRTLIARALAVDPDILVLDEPTNGMDLSSRTAILELVRHFHEHDHLTVVMVTHLLSDVANYVNRIALVRDESVQPGSVREILSSENLSDIYRMPVIVERVHGSTVIVPGTNHD